MAVADVCGARARGRTRRPPPLILPSLTAVCSHLEQSKCVLATKAQSILRPSCFPISVTRNVSCGGLLQWLPPIPPRSSRLETPFTLADHPARRLVSTSTRSPIVVGIVSRIWACSQDDLRAKKTKGTDLLYTPTAVVLWEIRTCVDTVMPPSCESLSDLSPPPPQPHRPSLFWCRDC